MKPAPAQPPGRAPDGHQSGTATFPSDTVTFPIGYLLRMYPRFSQTFVVNEMLELERQGVDLHIASLRRPNEGVFHESITRIKARADYLPETLVGQVRKHLRTQWKLFQKNPDRYREAVRLIRRHRGVGWFELIQAGEVLRWARKRGVRHLHVHFGTDEATVVLLSRLLGGPTYSLTLHAFDIFRNTVDRALLARKINASRFTVTVCESNRRYLVDQLPGVDPDKIRVNYNGIDLDRFERNDAERDPLTLFTVGRLIEKKGFTYLIDAVKRLHEKGLTVTCGIAGDGRERSRLAQQIKRLGLLDHVHLLGPLRQQEVRRQMQRASCFVLPCVQAGDGNVDALPTVLLESLACGCPTVSTRLSGIPEIIEDGVSGLLVEPGQPEPLAGAIRRLLEDRPLAARLADGGLRRARERFDVTRNVATMREWLCGARETTDGDDPSRSAGAKPHGVSPSSPVREVA